MYPRHSYFTVYNVDIFKIHPVAVSAGCDTAMNWHINWQSKNEVKDEGSVKKACRPYLFSSLPYKIKVGRLFSQILHL
jgi:hypothetical protein